ncbi:EAL domain-containing protein [Cycloclasticus zancles]|jgi:diguanylate cyclase (GGDEF)-like protein|uniref:Diguanylate cyclase n=1 Tax=Cycloclasticus zancles 78-ME TaxID=1198232 RepID=S5TWB8_9GAMM|nr:EAL domain-containing protein [Cycloclasticus zancles]AGS39273.1 Diguanylate cyclase [Cycloclasticus zancles 78-ME]
MTKRTVLTVDFSTKEIKALELALNTTKTDVTLTPTTINRLKPESYSDANLVVVKLNDDDSKNEDLIRKVKQYFLHFPIILLTERHLSSKEVKLYDANNIIDIRSFNPVLLVAKSIAREVTLQHNKYLLHQVNSQFKNESYRFESFLKHTEDGVALIHDGQYWATNSAYKRIFNIPDDENIICKPVMEFSTPTSCPVHGNPSKRNFNTSLESLPDETVLSVLIQTRDGDSFITTLYKTDCFVKEQLCTQILIHNPDAWSSVEKGFTDLRTFDHETGLYNKRFVTEYIDKEIASEEAHGSLAIILIDDFRTIREQHGINYTDDVIRSLSRTINETCSQNDILARYGDAVFTLFSDELGRSEFLLSCQKILTQVNNTLFGDDSQYIKLTLSIGVSFIDPRVTTSKQLTSQADKACDKASSHGGNQIHVFDSVTTPLTVIIDEAKNTHLIQSALEQDRLHPLYQPIVELSQKKTENYAVLLRILDSKNAHIPPDHFILTAEKTGLISQLDEWVLKSTLEQIKEASRQGIKRKFFISISNITYRNTPFIETLVSELKFYNIDASLLVFQISFSDVKIEPTVLKNFITVIKKECGCQIAFDQIGFSQITDSILKEYHVDYLKIDGTFSQNLLNNEESQQTIKDLIQVTRRNNVKTIAKSVENANTLALLWNLGIDAVQGYFLQEPSDIMRFDFDLNN